MIIKKEIRIIGWDDAPFPKGTKGKVPLIGTIFRGGSFLDGLLRVDIEIDGLDATDKIIGAMRKTRHKDLRIIMLDGITFGGFNIVDMKRLYEETKLPVIAVVRKKPDMEGFIEAMKKLDNFEERMKAVKNAGKIYRTKIKKKNKYVYFQKVGITKSDCEKVINISSTRSLIPEPLRVSHIIASGLIKGESIGRA